MTNKAKPTRVETQGLDKRRAQKLRQVRRRTVDRAAKAARRGRPARP